VQAVIDLVLSTVVSIMHECAFSLETAGVQHNMSTPTDEQQQQ
jgi:hypothetical protein